MNKPDYMFRAGHIDDIEAVFRLNRAVFDESWSKDVMLQSLQVGYDLYVCWDADDLLGYVLSQDILYETHIMQLAVAEHCRGRGMGRKLLRMLMQDKQDMEALMLEVRLSNAAAQGFYRCLGFVQVGQRPHYYSKTKTMPREDAVVMRFACP